MGLVAAEDLGVCCQVRSKKAFAQLRTFVDEALKFALLEGGPFFFIVRKFLRHIIPIGLECLCFLFLVCMFGTIIIGILLVAAVVVVWIVAAFGHMDVFPLVKGKKQRHFFGVVSVRFLFGHGCRYNVCVVYLVVVTMFVLYTCVVLLQQ